MYQCGFINHNECATLMGDADSGRGYAYEEQEICGKSLYVQFNFALSQKLLQRKIRSFFENGFYIHSYQQKKACHIMRAKHRSTGLVRMQKERR